ncbi:MAG: SDR family NAD(P)-dependent oxidoreductase, partial [Candidatus Competibacteraceae bacterium]|nr:SDR family NAD(P)-dependent oxidoreductase [Candidatus Competibacteraceae bacterium]
GGQFTFPLAGAYHSTKYALESINEALRFEVKPFGIDVIVVQPAAVETPLAQRTMESIKLNPRFPDAYAYMGDVLLKLKDREGAKEAYKACFEVDRPVVMVAMAGLNYWVWLIKRLISVPLLRIAPG